jgi:hypothetical protein
MSTDMTKCELLRDRLFPEPVLQRAQLSDNHKVSAAVVSAILKEIDREVSPSCEPAKTTICEPVGAKDCKLLLKLATLLAKGTPKSCTEEVCVRDTLWLLNRAGLRFVNIDMELSWVHSVAPAAEPTGFSRSRKQESHIPNEAPNILANTPPVVAAVGDAFDGV